MNRNCVFGNQNHYDVASGGVVAIQNQSLGNGKNTCRMSQKFFNMNEYFTM